MFRLADECDRKAGLHVRRRRRTCTRSQLVSKLRNAGARSRPLQRGPSRHRAYDRRSIQTRAAVEADTATSCDTEQAPGEGGRVKQMSRGGRAFHVKPVQLRKCRRRADCFGRDVRGKGALVVDGQCFRCNYAEHIDDAVCQAWAWALPRRP